MTTKSLAVGFCIRRARLLNVVIIGGMAAGCRAAARLSRLSAEHRVTIVERSPFISFSSCGLPLFASGEVDGISNLYKTSYGAVRDAEFFREVKRVKVLTETEVVEVRTEKNEVACKPAGGDGAFTLPYDSLIFATGSEPVRPTFPCVRSPLISSFHYPGDAENFRKAAQKGKVATAVIIGGGNLLYSKIEKCLSTRDVAENPLQNYLTTKVTKKWRKEHKERAINE